MSRQVISVACLAGASNGRLVVDADALVTPAAVDAAASQGIAIVRQGSGSTMPSMLPGGADDDMAARIRSIVCSMLATGGGQTTPTSRPAVKPVKLCKQADYPLEDFPFPGPSASQRVQSIDAVTSEDGPMAAGYMTLTEGSFPWTLSYDEVQIVLEGELHIGTENGERVGRPGDILYVPKGSKITFGTPSWAKFIYVTFPSNWADGIA